ncbi:MAG: hypothetical protein ACRCT8_07615 [Lacipirellulaceae bacterium]
MNAMQRLAWTELLISVGTLGLAAGLYPWLGFGARGAFALLGLMALPAVYTSLRGHRWLVDERD